MKTYLFLFFALITHLSQAQDFSTPVGHLQHISTQMENINKKYLGYVSASAHGKREKKVEALRQKLLTEIQEARMNIASMPPYKGNKAFRDTAVQFMKLYYNVMNEDYAKIINLEEIAEQSYDMMEALMLAEEKVNEKLRQGNDKLNSARKTFAVANNINLIESETKIGSLMEQATTTNKYYHDIYLLFFKPYKQEFFMLEAMNKENMTSVEQNRNAMGNYAKEAIEKLKRIDPFEGDNRLLAACSNMLFFYVNEAESMSPVTDYYLAKDKFDAAKKAFEKGSRTKEATDAYNKAVNEVNKASQSSNNVNEKLNKQRTALLNDWNRAVSNFLDDHTPKFKDR